MSEFRPILIKELDVEKVNFTRATTMPNGAKLFFLEYNGVPLVIQSPEMSVPFDPQIFEEGPNAKWSVKTSLNLSTPLSKEFFEKMTLFDNRLKELGKENAQEWFKKKNVSDDVIESMYSQSVREHMDQETGEPSGRYPPTFGFKVKKRDGNIMCRCFDENKDEINFNNPEAENHMMVDKVIKKNSTIKGLFKCDFVWHSPGKFGCSWSAQQLKVKTPKGFDGYAFNDDDDEDDTERLAKTSFVESEEEEEVVEDA